MDVADDHERAQGARRATRLRPSDGGETRRRTQSNNLEGSPRGGGCRTRLLASALLRHRWWRSGRHRTGSPAAPAQCADDHRRKKRKARRQLAQALQVALPARSGLVRPSALSAVSPELAGVLTEGQDRGLARNVYKSDGAQLLGLDRMQEGILRRQKPRMDRYRAAPRQGSRHQAKTAGTCDGNVSQAQHAEIRRHGYFQGRSAPFLAASGAGQIQEQESGRDRLEKFPPKYLWVVLDT